MVRGRDKKGFFFLVERIRRDTPFYLFGVPVRGCG